MATALFACTRCNSRHPFEELSQGQQLCKDCRGAFPIVKCTYCRTEFQQETKAGVSTICRKCEQNVKAYGKPSACEYCNIIAAFIGTKCQRCTNSEKKYGLPLTCEQCKQRCAFDRKDDSRKKVDGKLLCWLCTLSYKRALAKAKQNDPMRHSSISLHKSSSSHRSSSHGHKHSSSFSSSQNSSSSQKSSNSSDHGNHSSSKKARLELNKKTANGTLPSKIVPCNGSSFPKNAPKGSFPTSHHSEKSESSLSDPNSSDHLVALTQLREQIASLQKQHSQKDQQLLSKDKQISELKALHLTEEKELRTKLQNLQKQHAEQVQELQTKLRALQKQVATLTKANKKSGNSTDSPQS